MNGALVALQLPWSPARVRLSLFVSSRHVNTTAYNASRFAHVNECHGDPMALHAVPVLCMAKVCSTLGTHEFYLDYNYLLLGLVFE